MSKYNTATRGPRWNGKLDDEGVRRTKLSNKKKMSHTIIEKIIVEFTLPDSAEDRKIPAKNGNPAIHYHELMLPINDGFVKINSFLGKEAIGQTVICEVKLGREEHIFEGKQPTRRFYYLKLTPSDQSVDHELKVAPHDLALQDMVQEAGGDAVVVELSELNNTHQGGIIVKPL